MNAKMSAYPFFLILMIHSTFAHNASRIEFSNLISTLLDNLPNDANMTFINTNDMKKFLLNQYDQLLRENEISQGKK